MTIPDSTEKISPVSSAPAEVAVPPLTLHCGAVVHNWSSYGDPGPGEKMKLTCVDCGEKTVATPSLSLNLPGEHLIPPVPHTSLSDAMRTAEDRRTSNLTATMINQAIGMTLVKLGKTEITFAESEIIDFAANHRVVMHQNLDYSFTVSVIPRVPG